MTGHPVRRLATPAWTALGVNVVVILLGALVRATNSGAGCGRSWPTCEGRLIPSELEGATLIEFTHRSVSGVALLVVAFLYLRVRAAAERRTPLRLAAFVSVVAIVIEALIGAGIVLFEWVVDDSSVARTVAVPLHLVNTLLLLAALTAVVVLADARRLDRPARSLRRAIWAGTGAMLLVAASGAVAALADTLFPAESLTQGLADDFSGTAAVLTRLRVVHPILAVLTGLLLIWIVGRTPAGRPWRDAPAARSIVWLVVAQVAAGALNVALLVPVWMQLVHLLLADLLWISFVWYALEVSTDQRSAVNAS